MTHSTSSTSEEVEFHIQAQVTRGPHLGEVYACTINASAKPLRIGRNGDCWIRLRRDIEVSGFHAHLQIASSPHSLTITDQKSTNGTKLNGVTLVANHPVVVKSDDLVMLGKTAMRFHITTSPTPYQDSITNGEPELEPPLDSEVHVGSEAKGTTCIICSVDLRGTSLLEQHMHVNACLDSSAHPSDQYTLAPRLPAANNTVKPNKKKRKRAREPYDEEMATVLAISSSLLTPKQQDELEMTQLTSTIEEIDHQLRQLKKKRIGIVKKLERLETKLQECVIRPPEQARQLECLKKAMGTVFLSNWNKKKVENLRVFNSSVHPPTKALNGNYVTMWKRASQTSNGQCDIDLYYNQVFRKYANQMTKDSEVVISSKKIVEASRHEEVHSTENRPVTSHVTSDEHAVSDIDKPSSADDTKEIFEMSKSAEVEAIRN